MDEYNWDDFDSQTAEYLSSSPEFQGYDWSPDQLSFIGDYLAQINGDTTTDPSLGLDLTEGSANFTLPESDQALYDLISQPTDSYQAMPTGDLLKQLTNGDGVMSSGDGEDEYVKDKDGNVIGYLDKDGNIQYYADIAGYRTSDQVESDETARANSAPKGSAQWQLKEAQAAQALRALQTQNGAKSSGIGQALSGLNLAALLAKTLTGKNQGATTSARSNQGQAFAPTYQKSTAPKTKYASGGDVKGGLLPISAKLLAEMQRRHGKVRGEGGGQDDVVDIKAAPGEYVFDAESVSHLGDGNTDEGVRKLDKMRENIRAHKRQGPLSQIAPKAKSTDKYLKGK